MPCTGAVRSTPKGSLACFVVAGAAVEVPPGWRITVIGAVGEESASHGASFVCDHYRPQMLVIGEPSKWDRITLGFKGSLWVSYLVQTAYVAHRQRLSQRLRDCYPVLERSQNMVRFAKPTGRLRLLPAYPQPARHGFDQTTVLLKRRTCASIFRLPPGVTIDQVKDKLCDLRQAGELNLWRRRSGLSRREKYPAGTSVSERRP